MIRNRRRLVQLIVLIVLVSALVTFILWWLSPTVPVPVAPTPTPTPAPVAPVIDPIEESFNKRLAAPVTSQAEILDEETDEEKELSTSPEKIRNEIRMSLINVYAAEESFFTENGRYSTDLRILAWSPNDPSMAAQIGFVRSFDPPDRLQGEDLFFLNTDQFVAESFDNESGRSAYHYAKSAEGFSLRMLESSCKVSCGASTTGFEVLGAANLDDDDVLDVWRMNEKREMEHVIDDLAP